MAQSDLLVDRDWKEGEPAARPAVNFNAVHEQAQRVLSDPLFHNSKRYSDMLKYIVDRTLDGRHNCLKERIIGIEVFERSPDYDTSVDSIVRVAAAEVRKRLTRYYEEPEHDHELRIELPMRSYVAEFKQFEPVLQVLQEQPVAREQPVLKEPKGEEPKAGHRWRSRWRSYLWIPVTAAALALGTWGAQRLVTPARPIDRFWAPMMNSSGSILITIGSPVPPLTQTIPSGVAPASSKPGIPLSEFIEQQVNFPIADLSAASEINSFLARHGRVSTVRLAGSTSLSDLHVGPVVILGGILNEWTMRFGANLPFRFHRTAGLQWIEDTSDPSDRKWSVDVDAPYEQVTSEYALITRGVDKTTGQWWIGIGGVTVLGTLAAQQIVVDPKAMTALSAQLPKDWDRKNLQIVLEIKMVKGSFGASQVVATRSW